MSVQGIIGKVTGGTAIANAFLVAVQKIDYDVKGPDNVAFAFVYRGEDTAELKADITDHFIEDNTAIQDQIALRPKEVTLHGFIGEVSNQLPGLLQKINEIVSRLTVLTPYVPALTAAALVQYNNALRAYNSIANAAATVEQAFSMFGIGADHQTKQQKAYGYFESKFDSRALFTVQTPWKIFENMAIVSLHAIQNEDDSTMTDFAITFKEIRFANTLSSNFSIVQGRLQAQSSSTVDRGFQNPPETASLSSLLGGASVQGSVFGS